MCFAAADFGGKALGQKVNIPSDSDKFSETVLPFRKKAAIIETSKADNFNESDHPRDENGKFTEIGGGSSCLSEAEKSKISKRLVGQKTHDGIEIKSISKHAFDRVAGRKMSNGRIERMMKEGVVSEGNRPHTRCYDIDGSRMVVDTNSGNIMTVMWRKRGKKE